MTRAAMRRNPPVEARAWRSAAGLATAGVKRHKSCWTPDYNLAFSKPNQPSTESPTHVLTAVGGQVGAGDPGCFVRDEERHRIGNFVRQAQSTSRDLRDDLVT